MTSKEALILLLRSHFGDERAKRKVDKYCDEYIVWNPTQIKSIYNNGNWSWYSRNVFETLNRELERYL